MLLFALQIHAQESPDAKELERLEDEAQQALSTLRFQEAVSAIDRLILIQEKISGPKTPTLALALLRASGLYAQAQQLLKSGEAAQRAIDILISSGAKHAMDLAMGYQMLANAKLAQDPSRAAELYQKSIDLRAKTSPNDPLIADCYFNLALIAFRAGDTAKGKPYLDEGVRRRQRAFGMSAVETGETHALKASLYQMTGELSEAEKSFQAALQIFDAKLSPSHPRTISVRAALAGVYADGGRYTEAIGQLETSLPILQRDYGTAQPQAVSMLASLSKYQAASGKSAEAESGFKQCAEYAAQLKDSALQSECSRGLGELYRARGEIDASIPFLFKAAQQAMESRGPNDPRDARLHHELGIAYLAANDLRKAQVELQQSVQSTNADHPDGVRFHCGLIELYEKQQQWTEVEKEVQLAIHADTFLEMTLTNGSERDRIRYAPDWSLLQEAARQLPPDQSLRNRLLERHRGRSASSLKKDWEALESTLEPNSKTPFQSLTRARATLVSRLADNLPSQTAAEEVRKLDAELKKISRKYASFSDQRN